MNSVAFEFWIVEMSSNLKIEILSVAFSIFNKYD